MTAESGRRVVTAEELADAIGKIDASYVKEADTWHAPRFAKKLWRISRAAAVAACLLLVIVAVIALPGKVNPGPDGGRTESILQEEAAAGEADGAASGEAGAEKGGLEGAQASGEEGGEADGAASEVSFGIPEEVTEVLAIYECGGAEEQYLLTGQELLALRQWADSLALGEAVAAAGGEAMVEPGKVPGENGAETSGEGETYTFRYGETEISYLNAGNWYLVTEDSWYPVQNPSKPPLP